MTPGNLRDLIDYDPNSGLLVWKARASKWWNDKFEGKPAVANSTPEGYLTGWVRSRHYKAHRVAWAIFHGEWPKGLIDHIDGDPSNNRIANLRVVDDRANCQNQGLRSNNRSGEQGISWFARDGKWWVKITVAGRPIHVGYFDEMRDAIIARNAAYKVAGFHKNHGQRAGASIRSALVSGSREEQS